MTPPIGQLYSYADLGEPLQQRADHLISLGVPFVWDSGAFSAFTRGTHIDPEAHASWVIEQQRKHETAEHLRFIGLDVIGDPAATLDNYRAQRSAGARVEPTATFGSSAQDVEALLNVADTAWLNAGNLVGRDPQQIAAFLAFLRRLTPPEVRIHALGVTNPSVAAKVQPDGMDSSSWLTWAQYGRIKLFDRRHRRWVTLSSDPAHWDRVHRRGTWLRNEWGLHPSDIFAPVTVEHTARMLAVACESMLRFIEWVNELRGDATLYLASDRPNGYPAYRYLSTFYLVGPGNSDVGYNFARSQQEASPPTSDPQGAPT